MNEANTIQPTLRSRIAFEGPLPNAFTHLLALLPGAPVTLQVNAVGWDLRQLVKVHTPSWPGDGVELSGHAEGEGHVHLGFVTITGLGERLRAERWPRR